MRAEIGGSLYAAEITAKVTKIKYTIDRKNVTQNAKLVTSELDGASFVYSPTTVPTIKVTVGNTIGKNHLKASCAIDPQTYGVSIIKIAKGKNVPTHQSKANRDCARTRAIFIGKVKVAFTGRLNCRRSSYVREKSEVAFRGRCYSGPVS